jgi:DNA-binding response OmpR family regulator
MRVLLVEDDDALVEQLAPKLHQAGYAVDRAADGPDALFLGESESYDVIILDLGLPVLPGLDVLRRWRDGGLISPVLVLTARDTWREKVDGLKAGADDYLTKPFHAEELLARLDALIRRSHGQVNADLKAEAFSLNLDLQQVRFTDGRVEALTGTEFRLLRYFMLNRGKPLSKTRLTEHVYDQEFDRDSNLIEVYVSRLREKIGRNQIETRRGQGYVFRG